jgi:lycopene cyclase domain-containing protein
MSLYLTLELITIAVPLVFSFEKKMQFYKRLKTVIISLILVGAVFLIFDIYSTSAGVWGFNRNYHSNIIFLHLPLEEWLFFFAIPYACIFLHYTFLFLLPQISLSNKTTRAISVLLSAILLLVIVLNTDKTYTWIISVFALAAIVLSSFCSTQILNRFYLTFLVILIPFFIINGVLTGSFIDEEVFWYNSTEILGIRVFTVPVEDILFAFSLVLFNLLAISKLERVRIKSQEPRITPKNLKRRP